MTNANGSASGLNWLAMSIIDLVKGRHTDPRRVATDYQAYAVASDGQLTGFKEIICRDDGQAISKAKRMAKDYDIEVRNGSRFVIRLVRGPK